ncbi:MAG TPA: RHS repeat-associated core domain-containing protein [Polyangia bacterium]
MLEEAIQYGDQNRVAISATATQALTFTYGVDPASPDCSALPAGDYYTRVVDAAAPAGDPWASSCRSFQRGRLLGSSTPSGCSGQTAQYRWIAGQARSAAQARRVASGSGSAIAWTTSSYDPNTKALTQVVENANGQGSDPPGGLTRTTTYVYGNPAFPTLPTSVTRSPSLLAPGAAASTSYAYDDLGNIKERHESGYTCPLSSGGTRDQLCASPAAFDYVTRTQYRPGTNQPTLVSGPDDASAPAGQWHTQYIYYDGTGEGQPARAHRVKQILRSPTRCGPEPCLPFQFVEREFRAYDDFGRAVDLRDGNGGITIRSYDPLGRLLSESRFANPGKVPGTDRWDATTYSYDFSGRLATVTHPARNVDHYYYETEATEFSRLRAITRAAQVAGNGALPSGSERAEYYYDRQGNVTSERSYAGPGPALGSGTPDRILERSFLPGRVLQVTNGTAVISVETPEPQTRAVLQRVEHGDPPQTTSYTYEWGRVARVNETSFSYDSAGNLVRTQPAADTGIPCTQASCNLPPPASAFLYDDLGRLVRSFTPDTNTATPSTNANAGVIKLTYEPSGSLHARVDAAGRTVGYFYDNIGRLVTEEASAPDAQAPGGTVTYSYDATTYPGDGAPARAIGRLSGVTDTAGATMLAYDYEGRVAREGRANQGHPLVETRYDYTPNGSLATVTYPDGRHAITYAPDARDPDRIGRVDRYDSSGAFGLATAVTWHSGGRLAGLTYGNQATLALELTPDGRSSLARAAKSSGEALFSLQVAEQDVAGRPLRLTRGGLPAAWSVEQRYAYDDRGRVTSAFIPGLDVGYATPYDGVTYSYPTGHFADIGNRQSRRWWVGSPEAALLARTETYTYEQNFYANGSQLLSDRLLWMKDPVAPSADCRPADGGVSGDGGAAGDQGDNGCRDHGNGLGCHDAGPGQRHRDAGQRGGPAEHETGIGKGQRVGAAADAGQSAGPGPVDSRPPCAPGQGTGWNRDALQQDYLALLEAIRRTLDHPGRSYNRIGGLIARFLAKHHVTPRTFMRALLSQGRVRDGLVRLFDRREWNGPRSAAERAAAVAGILNAAAVLQIGPLVQAFETQVGDDVCYGYDQTGNTVWEGYNEPGNISPPLQTAVAIGCSMQTARVDCGVAPDLPCIKACANCVSYAELKPTYHDMFCYRYDAWNRLSEIGTAAVVNGVDFTEQKGNPCLKPGNFVGMVKFAYDYRGRRVSKVYESTYFDLERNYLYDSTDRLISEYATSSAGGDYVPERNYYFLAGELLAQEVLAKEQLTLTPPGGGGCGGCAGTITPAANVAGLMLFGLGPVAGVFALRAWRRGDRRRGGGLGGLAVFLVAAPWITASCVTIVPLASGQLYYYHNDFLGTPHAMSDNNATALKVVWAARYEPFGQAQINDDVDGDGVGVENAVRLPGQYDDALKTPFGVGPYYNYHRYYDPATGRYTQVDPAMKPVGMPGFREMHPYSYVDNDPLSLVDPSGLYWIAAKCVNRRQCQPRPDERVWQNCPPPPRRPKNKAAWDCIASLCRNAVVACGDNRECLRESGPSYYDRESLTAGVCYSWMARCPGTPLGAVVVHEFAHACGWNHNEPGDVPYPSGQVPCLQ